MDARTPVSDGTGSGGRPEADEAAVGARQNLSAYGQARRRRDRVRKIIRGTIGIAAVLVLWHVMAVAYDLQQILPTPLSVARTVPVSQRTPGSTASRRCGLKRSCT